MFDMFSPFEILRGFILKKISVPKISVNGVCKAITFNTLKVSD